MPVGRRAFILSVERLAVSQSSAERQVKQVGDGSARSGYADGREEGAMGPWLTMLLLAAQAATPAGQWRVLASDQDSVISLDEASVTRNGNSVRARIRAVFAEPYNGAYFSIGEFETDCGGKWAERWPSRLLIGRDG
jgi:hypothetical protein